MQHHYLSKRDGQSPYSPFWQIIVHYPIFSIVQDYKTDNITKTISHPPLNGSSESFNDIIKASYEELGVGTTHILKVYAGNVIGTSLVKSYSFTVPNTQRTSNNIQLLIYYYYFYYYYYLLQITKSPKVLHNQSFNVMLLLLLLLLLLFV